MRTQIPFSLIVDKVLVSASATRVGTSFLDLVFKDGSTSEINMLQVVAGAMSSADSTVQKMVRDSLISSPNIDGAIGAAPKIGDIRTTNSFVEVFNNNAWAAIGAPMV